MKSLFRSIKRGMDCMDDYRYCLEGFPRKFLHVAMNHVRKEVLSNFCGHDIYEGMFV